MHFLGGVVVAAPKISLRLTDDEVAFLSALSEELQMTKSGIIRMALRALFDRCFNPSPKILLSNSGFQNLLDEIFCTNLKKARRDQKIHLVELVPCLHWRQLRPQHIKSPFNFAHGVRTFKPLGAFVLLKSKTNRVPC